MFPNSDRQKGRRETHMITASALNTYNQVIKQMMMRFVSFITQTCSRCCLTA